MELSPAKKRFALTSGLPCETLAFLCMSHGEVKSMKLVLHIIMPEIAFILRHIYCLKKELRKSKLW